MQELTGYCSAATTAAAVSTGASGFYGFSPPANKYLHVCENMVSENFIYEEKTAQVCLARRWPPSVSGADTSGTRLRRLAHWRSRAHDANEMLLAHGMDLTWFSSVM